MFSSFKFRFKHVTNIHQTHPHTNINTKTLPQCSSQHSHILYLPTINPHAHNSPLNDHTYNHTFNAPPPTFTPLNRPSPNTLRFSVRHFLLADSRALHQTTLGNRLTSRPNCCAPGRNYTYKSKRQLDRRLRNHRQGGRLQRRGRDHVDDCARRGRDENS